MSANNWQQCPRCRATAEKRKKNIGQTIGESYGKVPEDEYNQLVAELAQPISLDETLREDWEIGIFDDKFYIAYSASCSACGFSKEFSKEERLAL